MAPKHVFRSSQIGDFTFTVFCYCNTSETLLYYNVCMKVEKNERIWELDAARGIAILCVCVVHAFYYLDRCSSLIINWSPFFYWIKQYGGTFFVILSGLCASLGIKSNVKRGLLVLGCGFALTLATELLYICGIEDATIRIQWGVLHMIGFAMLAYNLFKKLPDMLLLVLSLAIILGGYYLLANVRIKNPWLFPLALRTYPFYAMDYFPILPHLGWYMFGSLIGKYLYKEKKSLLDWKCRDGAAAGFLCFCGRNSLIIYMVHQVLFYLTAQLI